MDIMGIGYTTRKTKMVTTNHEFPPIPSRSMDWSAVVSETYDPENDSPVGHGKTEEDAVLDLLRATMEDMEFSIDFLNALEGYLALLVEKLPKEHRYGFTRCVNDIMGVLE